MLQDTLMKQILDKINTNEWKQDAVQHNFGFGDLEAKPKPMPQSKTATAELKRCTSHVKNGLATSSDKTTGHGHEDGLMYSAFSKLFYER